MYLRDFVSLLTAPAVMSCYPSRVMMFSDIRRAFRGRRLRRLTLGLCVALMAFALSACLIELGRLPMGEVNLAKGNVFLARAELMHPEPVIQPYPVFAEDVIETQARSRARIALPQGLLMLGPNTRLTFRHAAVDRHTIVGLERGTLGITMTTGTALPWTVEILAAGSTTTTQNGEVTVWVQEDFDGQEAGEPGLTVIRSIGVINHGNHGEATFHAMGRSVIVRPGYLSATAPGHSPVPAVAIEMAKRFVTDIVQGTNPELNPNNTMAMNMPSPPRVKRVTETVTQRACKKQKEHALRIKPSVDQTKTRQTHCL